MQSQRSTSRRDATVAVLDTTLRDGEQTPGLAYTPAEKRELARVLLTRVGVDRIEIASACVSEGEREAVRGVVEWAGGAGVLERVAVLGFCDGGRSVQWMTEAGARNMHLLCKGSERHCRIQLGQSTEEHLGAIRRSLDAARAAKVCVSGAYLEDWSRGMVESPDHVVAVATALLHLGVERLFLADTVGCLCPDEVRRHVTTMRRAFPEAWLEFHGHNDYGLATANALAAVGAGVDGVHASINGLGERAGNASLAEVVVALHDHTAVRTAVDEAALYQASLLVERYSGKRLADNAPLAGADVFTQTAGVHADGDRKGNLYASRLSPERFGRARAYALGKFSGRASVDQNLEALGITLDEDRRDRLLARIVELGDRKRAVLPSELPDLLAALCVSGGAFDKVP
jgi:D-citramalate synthase